MNTWMRPLTAVFAIVVSVQSTFAVTQEEIDAYFEEKSNPAPELRGEWAQGAPLTLESLRGKVAVLIYFEETCPSCAKMWPDRMRTAKAYEGKPVVFIAVNSGNAAPAVQAYMRRVRCDWPTIADVDRQFEQASGVGQISLSNIHQTRIISPTGKLVALTKVTWTDGTKVDISTMDKALEYFASRAAWKIDPALVTPRYRAAWEAFEFGRLADAAGNLRQLTPQTDDEKSIHEQIQTEVDAVANARLAEAKAADDAGELWTAFKLYEGVRADFAGLESAEVAQKRSLELASDEQIKKERMAMTMLDRVRSLAARDNPAHQANARKTAALLIQKFPDTEAAEAAKAYQ